MAEYTQVYMDITEFGSNIQTKVLARLELTEEEVAKRLEHDIRMDLLARSMGIPSEYFAKGGEPCPIEPEPAKKSDKRA